MKKLELLFLGIFALCTIAFIYPFYKSNYDQKIVCNKSAPINHHVYSTPTASPSIPPPSISPESPAPSTSSYRREKSANVGNASAVVNEAPATISTSNTNAYKKTTEDAKFLYDSMTDVGAKGASTPAVAEETTKVFSDDFADFEVVVKAAKEESTVAETSCRIKAITTKDMAVRSESDAVVSLSSVKTKAKNFKERLPSVKNSLKKMKEKKAAKNRMKEAKKETATKPKAKLLTAGEVHDFSKWKLWQDVAATDLKMWQDHWGMYPTQRYTLQLTNKKGVPLVDAIVRLKAKNNATIWETRTDNTGKAELWSKMFGEEELFPHFIETEFNGLVEKIEAISEFKDGLNHQTIDVKCDFPDQVDLLFVVDATGSMGDEIAYLQAELSNVVEQTKSKYGDLDINLGSVFYRDNGDEYVTRKADFAKNINKTVNFIQKQSAGGGGDYPEAVDAALSVGIEELNWSKNAVARLLFLVLDAPPHNDPATIAKLHKMSQEAAKKGIRIIPITASGINKSTEYLMRSLALSTNGTYVFLTDDSGIGGSHLKPSTDDFKVELLNDLLLRLINQYIQTPGCSRSNQQAINQIKKNNPEDKPIHTVKAIKVFPNPSTGLVNLKTQQYIPELFVTDNSGKILERLTDLKIGKHKIRLDNYPSGMYFVRYRVDGKMMSDKVILVH